VSRLNESNDGQVIVGAILGLARGFGLTTTAEGIEDLEQLAYLKANGCTEGQGYLFSKGRPRGRYPRASQPDAGLLCGRLIFEFEGRKTEGRKTRWREGPLGVDRTVRLSPALPTRSSGVTDRLTGGWHRPPLPRKEIFRGCRSGFGLNVYRGQSGRSR
jgi:EAL domain-containing protein (putative c-di-GMP-specific phosphodiesterase class I)